MIVCRWPFVVVALVAALPVLAQTSGGFGAHDEDEPIEITADELEVRRDENVAVFSGDVDAVQGDLTLSADTLDVFYGQDDDATAAPDDEMGDIRRVVARGDVVVASPREVARGSEGVYDVAAQRITLTGDVVLTRDENVLRGNELEIDLATGISRLRATGDDGRVRAKFAPGGEGS